MSFLSAPDYSQVDNSGNLQVQAKNYIIAQIRAGRLKPGQHLPTVREISNKLAVSTTVTMAAIRDMRQQGWIERKPNRRHLVSDGARKLLLADRKIKIVFTSHGYEHIHVPAFQAIFTALLQEGLKNNIIFDCLLQLNDKSQTVEPGYYDAMIVAGWEPASHKKICKGLRIGLDWFEGMEVDCTVHTDNFKGARLIAEHLYGIGRRKVALWRGKSLSTLSKNCGLRLAGFLTGWAEIGGQVDNVDIIRALPRLDDKQLWPSLKDIESFKAEVLDCVGKYDSLFVDSDMWALQIWQILNDAKVRVPDDIALAGFDGIYEALRHDPPLTTIRNRFNLIAKEILNVIENKIVLGKNPEMPDILVEPELIIGGSTQKTVKCLK